MKLGPGSSSSTVRVIRAAALLVALGTAIELVTLRAALPSSFLLFMAVAVITLVVGAFGFYRRLRP